MRFNRYNEKIVGSIRPLSASGACISNTQMATTLSVQRRVKQAIWKDKSTFRQSSLLLEGRQIIISNGTMENSPETDGCLGATASHTSEHGCRSFGCLLGESCWELTVHRTPSLKNIIRKWTQVVWSNTPADHAHGHSRAASPVFLLRRQRPKWEF